jgi:hypothetical protein
MPFLPASTPGYRWKFFRVGGFDQVKMETGADLMALDQLDQKLWAALSCPTKGLELDGRMLEMIDSDKDGRIRVPEIIAAVKWAGSLLKNPDDLTRSANSLALAAMNDATPEGRQLLASARHVLATLGKPDAAEISIEDTVDTARIFAQTKLNGDGIVPPESAGDDATRQLILDIIACQGGEPDRSGNAGVSQTRVDQFFTEAQAFADWWNKSEMDAAIILPLGVGTADAVEALRAVRVRVEDYFTRVQLAAYDGRAAAALNPGEADYAALALKNLSAGSKELAGFPLARIEVGRSLSLTSGVNPAWSIQMAAFHAKVVVPLLGARVELTASEWASLNAKFAPFETWMAGKAGASVEKLGIVRIREILASGQKAALTALIARDKALESEFSAISALDRLVRYHRDLYTLLNNFVSFRDFYTRKSKAVFQAGTLYLDQRSCELCLRVEDPGKHAAMAGLAGTCLVYCDCTRKSTGEKMQIVAAVTGGDSDNLMVGRNGIFYDRQGRDWDATVTKLMDNPISIRQAFWAPYKKVVRMVEQQIAKRALAAEAASTAKLESAAVTTANVDKAKAPAEPKPLDVGVVAALGVAFGAIGTAMGFFLGIFKGMPVWQFPLVILGLMLLISTPSMLIAWLKLRKRNLGPILDANGWAVNAKARINVPFGASLTAVAALPMGAAYDPMDPFAEERKPWRAWLALAILAGLAFYWWQGSLDDYLPGSARSTTILGTNAPAYKPAPAPATAPPPAVVNPPSPAPPKKTE